jgi:hypothetical protein
MPVTSRESSAFPEVQGRVGSTTNDPVKQLHNGGVSREGYRLFLFVQASRSACHPGCSHRCGHLWPQGSRGVYVRAEHMSLPSCASNMLTVRIGQLTVGDFHPTRLAALSAAPGPVPRRASAVPMPVSSRRTSASPYVQEVRRAETPAMIATSMANQFRGCSHSVMFRLPHSLGPQIAPTVEAQGPLGSRAVYATQSTCGYPTRAVVSLRA